jgi:hypothetical protein
MDNDEYDSGRPSPRHFLLFQIKSFRRQINQLIVDFELIDKPTIFEQSKFREAFNYYQRKLRTAKRQLDQFDDNASTDEEEVQDS